MHGDLSSHWLKEAGAPKAQTDLAACNLVAWFAGSCAIYWMWGPLHLYQPHKQPAASHLLAPPMPAPLPLSLLDVLPVSPRFRLIRCGTLVPSPADLSDPRTRSLPLADSAPDLLFGRAVLLPFDSMGGG